MAAPLRSARRNYALSALIARRAVREARQARRRDTAAVATVVVAHQIAQARTSQTSVAEMLDEQGIVAPTAARLNVASFTTPLPTLEQMLAQIDRDAQALLDQTLTDSYVDSAFDRLVESIVQDAGRAAESVDVATRNVSHVRFVNPPCCARCAILAGRVYRWSEGFERHPGCDCSMIPSTVASPLVQDPDELVRSGQVRGLSKADMQALDGGANLNRVVNVRLKKAGLLEAGHALRRGNRLTPAGVYRLANGNHARALALLKQHGYIL